MELYKEETHPWKFHIPPGAGTLFIGTFPTAVHNWTFPFFYPNKANYFWKIMSSIAACNLNLQLAEAEAVAARKFLLSGLRIGVTDMGSRVARYKGLSGDEFLEVREFMPVLELLVNHPSVQTIALTSSTGRVSAALWFQAYLKQQQTTFAIPTGRKPQSVNLHLARRSVRVVLVPSPSPRSARRYVFEELVAMYKECLPLASIA